MLCNAQFDVSQIDPTPTQTGSNINDPFWPPPPPHPAGYIIILYDLMILTHHPSKNHKIRSKATLFTDDTHLLYIVTLLSVGSQAETIIWLHGTQNKIRTKQR